MAKPNQPMARRILIAPDKFKGSLSAPEAADAIAVGIRKIDPTAELDLCPIADGGEGFMETLAAALDGSWVHCSAVDALGRPVDSKYVVAEMDTGPVAIMEMAETAGLWRLSPEERNPLEATTRGTGMQMAHAISNYGVSRIIMGIGGSATNDGGCGMASALGVLFLDEAGVPIDPNPSNFSSIHRMDMEQRIALPIITAACDVDNPLLGERGATAIFSAQKGATDVGKVALEAALEHLVATSEGEGASRLPGAGAAGGLGFGLLHFAGAKLVSGFDLLADLLKLEDRIKSADHVVTGEGSIDHQSLSGKGPVALAKLAASYSIPVTGFCGLTDQAARDSGIFESLHALADTGLPLETLIAEAATLLTQMVGDSEFITS